MSIEIRVGGVSAICLSDLLCIPERMFNQYPDGKIDLPMVPDCDLDEIPKPAAAMRIELGKRRSVLGLTKEIN